MREPGAAGLWERTALGGMRRGRQVAAAEPGRANPSFPRFSSPGAAPTRRAVLPGFDLSELVCVPRAPPAPLLRLLGSYRLAAVPASRSIGTPFTSY